MTGKDKDFCSPLTTHFPEFKIELSKKKKKTFRYRKTWNPQDASQPDGHRFSNFVIHEDSVGVSAGKHLLLQRAADGGGGRGGRGGRGGGGFAAYSPYNGYGNDLDVFFF